VRLIGSSVRRVEDPRLLTGRGRFVDDVNLNGMVHAAVLRSPWPHARILAIDPEPARRSPGVLAVLTAADMQRDLTGPMRLSAPAGVLAPAFWPLSPDKARFPGDPVALVVAETRALAEDGCDLIEVEWEPLAPVTSACDAMAPGSALVFDELGTNVITEQHHDYGDVERAFADAARVITLRFDQHRYANVPMETRGAVADYHPGAGTLTFHAAHQNPHALRVGLAQLLGIPASLVCVLTDDIGGSFGQKAYVSREEVAVAVASRRLGRPVKWIEDRSENLLAAGHAREEQLEVSAAITATGELLGLKVAMVMDQGAYQLTTWPSSILPTLVRVCLPGGYRLRNFRFEAVVVATTKGTYIPYRGPWEVETWIRERMLDVIARAVGAEPLEIRRRNLLHASDLPTRLATGPTLAGIDPRATLERAAELMDLPGFRRRQAAARTEGRLLGFGLATFFEAAPGPPDYRTALGAGASPRTAQRAVARLEPDGTVALFTSQSPHGQGHHTTLAQLAATTLDVSMDQVVVVAGDTRVTPFNLVGTGGSRAATLASGATLGAAALLRDEILHAASALLEADEDDLELRDGTVAPRGVPSRALTLREIASVVWLSPGRLPDKTFPGLEAVFDFAIPDGGWTHATHCCWVEVDPRTGGVRIPRYLVVEDCGTVINPAIVDGQIRGGVAQGIGGVLLERAAYDEDGQMVTTTLVDYLLPTATDIPTIEISHIEPAPGDPPTYRGVGEGGAIGAPAALTNAIEDALAPYGVTITEQYLPPARILELAGLLDGPGRGGAAGRAGKEEPCTTS
jgi:carbon-monoxide dehydrogenase large subunit